MEKTNIGLAEYVAAQVGNPYWYGTYGQKATPNLLEQKARQYPSQYGGERVKYATANHLKKRVHDCVGLIKGYLWSSDETDVTKYNTAQDVSANGMYNLCKTKGPISNMPDIIGVLVFMDKHVGVYIGNGEVVEARNFDCGVQKTKLKDRKWTRWGYCPFIEYIAEEKKPKSVSKKQEKRAVTITNPVHKFLIL